MPSKKKKYNARFPAGRIKKIMQTDEEVGKVAQAVPVIISRTLELFVESLLTKTLRITNARNAKTLSPSHMKQCIISESRFDFLRDLVKNIPDIGVNEEQLSGSETGFGNEASASPTSTTTSSSSNGGGPGHTSNEQTTSGTTVTPSLQRSESYTPSSSSSSNYARPIQSNSNPITQPPQTQSQPNTLKRTLNHINSLNFYKEISLDDASSGTSAGYCREPHPKLSRLNSAPAVSATTTNSVPFKIDILPNLPSASPSSSNSSQQQQGKVNNNTASNNNSYKISYKIDPLTPNSPITTTASSPAKTATRAAASEQPIIKLDYSNLKLPMTVAEEQPKGHQPTIKIDLSNITNFSSIPQQRLPQTSILTGSNVQVPSTPTASTPSTPLSAVSSVSSSSISSSKNPYVFPHSSSTTSTASSVIAASGCSGAAAPVYSVASSAIPGMDEDYDDI